MKCDVMTPARLEKLRGEGEAGDAQAAYEVAEYHYGRREFTEAFAWYVKAAGCDNPNPLVYFDIGYAYQNGEGTKTDLVSAYDFYEKAAARHLPQALYNLAYFYQNGIVVKQDFARAEEYSRQAARELADLVCRLHDAEAREEKMTQSYLEILRGLGEISSQWRAVAEENASIREQLSEAMVKKNVWKTRAEEYEKKAAQLEAENRSMAELLLKAQYELEHQKMENCRS